ncbi:MAG: hypothetical protein HN522_00950 [Flavobacteriales bacterium]|jgi:hypothetical protein|nr:hypothetical protein [Flavobacteriales bacterium]MBT5089666.1 hypothetical protein [Flavobacteriales bacterium]
MKNFVFLSVVFFFFASCTNVYFVNSQPEGLEPLTEIPENLQGIYAFTDSIIVTSNTIGEDTLGKSLIVKKRGNFYYLNYFEDSVYSLTVVKIVKCLSFEDFEVFHPKITDDNKEIFNVVEVKSKTYGSVESKEYIVDNVSVVQLSEIFSNGGGEGKLIRIK